MPISRLKRAKYSLDLRLSRHEKEKLKVGHVGNEKVIKDLELDLKVIERMWEGSVPKREIVKISKELGLSPTYARILIKRLEKIKRRELAEREQRY